VLVAGGQNVNADTVISGAELYDPALGTWSVTTSLVTSRTYQTAALLPNGEVLVAAGQAANAGYVSSAELYNVGLGFNPSWQPEIELIQPFTPTTLLLSGSQFRGISEGSGGNTQSSPANYPVVQMLRLGNEQTVFLSSYAWATYGDVCGVASNFPPGYALVTMFVNGIPSTSFILGNPIGGFTSFPSFEITSIVVTNTTDLLITWNTSGTNNIVQVSSGAEADGSYSSNDFADVTNIVVTTATTNFWDVGAATNYPARYYRIRSPE
jgi:hypothetical protein